MTANILVPLDGSRFGEHALPVALSIARRTGATVQLLHVHVPLAPMYVEGHLFSEPSVVMAQRQHERRYLDDLVQRLREKTSVPLTTVMLEGPVVPLLRDQAQKGEAGLIVMTTHGRGAISRFWLGSVADQLLHDSPVPLLLVRPHEDAAEFNVEKPLQHILVPLDGSPLAEKILGPAMDLGQRVGAEFTLFQVIQPATPTDFATVEGFVGSYGQAMIDRLAAVEAQVRREAEEYLEKVAQRFRARGLSVATHVICHEQPAHAILEEAASSGMDLIALETHGRRGLARMFLGSVADKVVRGAGVPVLVHRPPAEQKVAATEKAAAAEEELPAHPGCVYDREPIYHPGM